MTEKRVDIWFDLCVLKALINSEIRILFLSKDTTMLSSNDNVCYLYYSLPWS